MPSRKRSDRAMEDTPRFKIPDDWNVVVPSNVYRKTSNNHVLTVTKGATYDDWSFQVTGPIYVRQGTASSSLSAIRKAELVIFLGYRGSQ